MTPAASAGKFGTLRGDLSPIKDKIDFWLTRFPGLYLAIEEYREWVNWDKRVYLSFVRPGDVVIDVGANVGAHTVFFSHLVGSRGQVLAFEPLPANLESLQLLLARRGRYANVQVVPSAVGNPDAHTDSAVLRVPGSDFSQASLKPQSAGSWTGEREVRSFHCAITSLDADERVHGLHRVNFIKLDVEGAELDVLKGAAATISRHRPLIYCEVYEKWARSFGYGPSDLMKFVRSLGYREARVIVDGRVHAYHFDAPLPEGWFATSSDVLFVLNEHRHLVLRFDERYLANRWSPPTSSSE